MQLFRLLLVTLGLLSACTLQAGTVYLFTGPNFDAFDGNGNGLSTSNTISASFEVTTSLGAFYNSFTSQDPVPTLVDFSITDGLHTITAGNGGTVCNGCFNVSTNGAGVITGWFFFATGADPLDRMILSSGGGTFSDGLGTIPSHIVSSRVGTGSAYYAASATYGSWEEVSGVPEPYMLVLTGAMLVALGLVRRRG